MGNYHAWFLGGKGAERPLPYPVIMTFRYPQKLAMYRTNLTKNPIQFAAFI